MPEKGGMGSAFHFFRPNSWLPWGLPSITGALLVAVILLWSLDSCSMENGIKIWRSQRDYLGVKLRGDRKMTHSSTLQATTPQNLTDPAPLQAITHRNLTHNDSSQTIIIPSLNVTGRATSQTIVTPRILTHNVTLPTGAPHEQEQQHQPEQETLSWISVQSEPNLTARLLEQVAKLHRSGNKPCAISKTATITVPGLDGNMPILSAGKIHEFMIFTYDEAGKARCSGGDFFETDLSGKSWKSRPPVKDLSNGSYSLSLQVHPDFAGDYILIIILLFHSFEALKQRPDRWVLRQELLNITVTFRRDQHRHLQLALPKCRKQDFRRDIWSGRWTHHGFNKRWCEIDAAGRFRCLKPDFPCQKPWCEGPLGSIESNGWVYSSHCSYRIFTGKSAWRCLQNRWFFFWGDSNHVDTIRNLVNFVLGLWGIKSVPRRFDRNFTNPANPSQSFRITSIFNGHWNETGNYQGLNSLRNEGFRQLLRSYFAGKPLPDVMVMNSGLHDGVFYRNMRQFGEGAEFAAEFWREVLTNSSTPGKRALPDFVFRNTVAAGGHARALAFNPHKIEVFNGILLEKFRKKGLVSGVIDEFDMTFPWHFDNNCSDGVHYGRRPAKANWYGQIGHQYFVDLMLVHVLLNALCLQS